MPPDHRDSVGLLTLGWKRRDVLERSLRAWARGGLLDLVDRRMVYFNEIEEADVWLARDWDFEVIGSSDNVGIGRAIETLVEAAETEYVIFVENDFELVEDPVVTRLRLAESVRLIRDFGVDYVRLRHRRSPGEPLHSRWFAGQESLDDRRIRPHVATAYHWITEPETHEVLSQVMQPVAGMDGWYRTSSRFANYTNNPHLCRRDWWLENLPGNWDGGGRNNEASVSGHWQDADFSVALGNGLFTHNDSTPTPV